MLRAVPVLQIDLGVSQIPDAVFIVIHLAILVVAAAFAVMSGRKGATGKWMAAFWLVALAELIYILYHLRITSFLLSHTIAEVLLLVVIILFFAGLAKGRRAA